MFKLSQKTAVIIYGFLFSITCLIMTLLYMQYRYFMQETQELVQVKESYYQHVEMLKRSLNESLVQQEAEELSAVEDKKKSDESEVASVETEPKECFIQSPGSDFELISADEEHRLSCEKKRRTKQFPSFKTTKNKKLVKKTFKPSASTPNRYIPHRDFVFHWPIQLTKFWLSSLYGPRKLSSGKISFHPAIDMAALKGTPVVASAAGKVTLAHTISGYGNCIMIEHSNRYKTRYAHLDSISVKPGQIVTEGQNIGTVGDSGYVRKIGKDASHLHFEIYQDGQRVNPLNFLFS